MLDAVAPGRWRQDELTVNYRTPAEVMALAAEVLHAIDPSLEPPQSVRESGRSPERVWAPEGDLAIAAASAAADALAGADGGTIGVLTAAGLHADVLAAVTTKLPDATAGEPLETQVSVLTVAAAKGLEFDHVVVVEPAQIVPSVNGLHDLYVALTRPTQHLVVVHAQPLPAVLDSMS
jgi:DNA helicase IV